ncbi:MAG: DUF2155 domain-containing protein [Pseudomonadota bacterium]
MIRKPLAALLFFLASILTGPVTAQEVENAQGGLLRMLDKTNGTVRDVPLNAGQTAQIGALYITLSECRYPKANPNGDAFALIDITDTRAETRIFNGWMIASAPALNPLDHPRYDVWVLRCQRA